MSDGLSKIRTWGKGAWAFCGRCGNRNSVSDMTWQRGKLLDKRCYDEFPLIGQIDKGIADALSMIVMEPDLQPDPKLTMPMADPDNNDIFI